MRAADELGYTVENHQPLVAVPSPPPRHTPGDIFSLPPDDRDRPDPKLWRPHILASHLDVDPHVATIVYCSTKGDEARRRVAAPNVFIPKDSSTFKATGLTDATYAYPSRLLTCKVSDLDEHMGILMDEMPALRQALRRAIGHGMGVQGDATSPARSSLRGMIVLFTESFKDTIGTPFGVIISEPAYSNERRFQNIIPIFEGNEYRRLGGVAVEEPWLAVAGWSKGLIVPRMVQSCLTQCDIKRALGVLNVGKMREVDDILMERFFKSEFGDAL